MEAEGPLERGLVERFPGLAPIFRGLDGRVTWIMTMAALFLIVFKKFGTSTMFEAHLRPENWATSPLLGLYGDYYWFCACFVILGVLPLVASAPKALRPASLGLGAGDWRFGLKWVAILYAIMLPVVAIASRFSTFTEYYPLNDLIGQQPVLYLTGRPTSIDHPLFHFVLYELLYALYFLGWEFFYRGWLTFGLYEKLGVNGVFIANIPFALMHVGKPFPEALGSIVAGIALGMFALRARSFWYCYLVHVGIAWTMDAAAIQRRIENFVPPPG